MPLNVAPLLTGFQVGQFLSSAIPCKKLRFLGLPVKLPFFAIGYGLDIHERNCSHINIVSRNIIAKYFDASSSSPFR